MKKIIFLFIRRPVTTVMILAALIIAAIFSLFSLPVNRLPEFSVPIVTVETLYKGMAANEIRSMVTIPLEDGLSPIKGLERIRSVSRDNRSLISLDFRWGTDPVAASVLVREAIDAVYPGLPEGVQKPGVTSGTLASETHAVIAVRPHNSNGEFARKLAEYELQARLRKIDGVGSIILVGGEVTEENLSLDIPRLTALGLSPSDFTRILSEETSDIPAGNARESNMELVVVSSGKPDSISALSKINLPIGNGAFKVQDAGKLSSSAAKRESIFVYNGKEAAALEVYRRPGADPLKLSKEIKKVIDEAASLFSRDAHIEIVADSSASLISGIVGLIISALLSAAAVITVLLLFIRRLKYSFLAALSIPVSAAAAICVLSLMGKSLNGMSLGGLAMGIGLVSDISVIVIDLLFRAFGKKDSAPNESAPCPEEVSNKVYSIAGSSIGSTITTAIVFLPIIMLPGPLGSLFGDIAIALVAGVSAGWIYAQFFLPSLYLWSYKFSFSLNKKISIKFKLFKNKKVFTDGSLVKKYSFFLLNLLRRPGKVFVYSAVLSLFGSIILLLLPVAFINPDDAEEVTVSVMPPPGTLLENVLTSTECLTNILAGLPSVKTVFGRAGAEEGDVSKRANLDYRKEEMILCCILKKGIKPEKALAEIKSAIAAKFPAKESISAYFPKDRAETLLGLSSERSFVIKGKDRPELLERLLIARAFFSAHGTSAAHADAQDSFKTVKNAVNFRPIGQRPELRLLLNREASAYLSIPAAQIAETLYILNEGAVATRLEIEGRPLNVRVTGDNTDTVDTIQRLEKIPLKTGKGKTVYLGSLGQIERKEADASLARLDRLDIFYADFTAGKDINSAIKKFAAQYSWFSGADESVFKRYKKSLLLYILLVLVLLFLTMGAQFESFLLPLILMMSIPFSLAGAGPALLIINAKIDSGAVLGLTTLFGLVVNNSLILFEISSEKIRNGFCSAAAVYRGASERVQAILITMITTVFALLPLIFSPLGNSQKSMAAAMLGGLTASTLLSLFAIPPVLIRYFKWKYNRNSGEIK
jgi:multidrug efflux pump subunit AcrB